MPDISSLASRIDAEFACATIEWQGKKFYFIGEETRREFAAQNKISIA
jgi:hypothetical protein